MSAIRGDDVRWARRKKKTQRDLVRITHRTWKYMYINLNPGQEQLFCQIPEVSVQIEGTTRNHGRKE